MSFCCKCKAGMCKTTDCDSICDCHPQEYPNEKETKEENKSIVNQMMIIDRLTRETFELKKEISFLKESRSRWAKQSSENAEALSQARKEVFEEAAKIASENNDKCDCCNCNKRFNITAAIRTAGEGK